MDMNRDLPWYKTTGIWIVGSFMWIVVILTVLGILFGTSGPGDTGRW